MAHHADVPGMGILGGGDFSGSDMITLALEEADAKDAAFEASQNGDAPLPLIAGSGATSVPLPSPAAALEVPDPVGAAGPAAPGGRPPAASPWAASSGSASAATASLLASLAVGGAAGVYFRSPQAAAAGFLMAGSALNLRNSQQPTTNPQESTWASALAFVGLGLGGYLAYGVYKDKTK